ncbi:outer membrane beta-barrel protein [Dysgonomonas macrotermitis]|uniref:CarboxypepD_reg-like domain-containing protein n=1 Tax=Dysgonomonas macrotermitis TaxID=1346286 RepID=A0A1M5DDG2_9BACT|nr:outer membrane beta-barrel protein [Dysgonomonas macrotermitis]SHF64921.1 CarboxypepD_reg-like domain-containing protein [Dysgonomonas macrotermitis]
MRYFYCIFLLFCLCIGSYAQTVTGTLHSSLKNEPVSYASIRLLSANDSTYVMGALTRDEGEFTLHPKRGSYILDISSLGYDRSTFSLEVSDKSDIDLGIILLKEAENVLGEAVVTASVPDIIVKGDTIEYNADAYRVGEDALLQDLVRRMPGIEVSSDGKLMANGKIISKILIDGKEFFDNDIDLALRNLPASMVNKLQLFKDQSEMSKLTGFKDSNAEQVLNLTVKEGMKKSVFGNARVGYGTDDRYSNKVNANYMEDDNQFALIGNMNNVTDNFEYSGVSSQYDGITKERNLSTNINIQRNDKISVGGNIRYEDNDNLFKMDSDTETFIEDGNRMSTQSSSSNNRKRNLIYSMHSKWTPDSLTTVYTRMSINTGTSTDIRRGESLSYIENQNDTTSGWSDYVTKGNTYSLNGSLVIGRKLNSKGRNISLSLTGAFRGSKDNGTNYSTTEYQSLNSTKIIDQELSIRGSGNNWGILLSYVEPLSKHHSLLLSYNYRQDYSGRDRLTYRKDGEGEYTIIDKDYTRNTLSRYNTQRFNVGFQGVHEKYEYSLGFSVDPTYSKNRSAVGDSLIEKQSQNVVNYSPTLKFTYRPSSNATFDFDYYGSTEHPTLRQLSKDTIIIDALSRTYGNPDLKPSFDNNVSMYYQISNYEKGAFFMITASGNYIVNKIVDYTIIDPQGNTESSYRNVKGNWGMNGGIMFNTPLRNKKITVDNSSFAYFVRNIGYSNGAKNITYNLTLSESFSINYKSENFNQRLQANVAFNITRNNLSKEGDLGTSNLGIKSSSMIKFPWDITLQNDISYTYNHGYSAAFKNSELLWNLAVSKQFMKKKAATVKLQCYDLLGDRNNLVRVVSGNYISDTKTNMIGRYVLFSFNYRFNFLNGKTSSAETQAPEGYGY